MMRRSVCLAAVFGALMPGAALAELYAAIAFSPSSGRSGTSWNYGSQGEAETEAYYQCGVNDCNTVVWFTQCGAIAVGDGYGYGTGYASSLDTATNTALQYCLNYTSNCEVTAAYCNDY